jgi:hypothetical protein
MSADPERRPDGTRPSWGNISEHHWSRARRGANEEALEYYRARSRAPGVAEGGAERNFYCMECDGVIPHSPPVERCPHCGAALDDSVRRYFNWVEIDRPVESDLRALLPLLLAVLVVLVALALGLVAWLA